MQTRMMFLLTVVLMIIFTFPQSIALLTNGTTQPPTRQQDVLSRPVDKSLIPMYEMSIFFLESILNPTGINILNDTVDLANWDNIHQQWEDDWTFWFRHYYHYTICVAFGLAYALAIVIAGFVLCCSHCCGRYHTYPERPVDGKYTKCQRRTLASFLFIITTIILYGVISMIIANSLIFEQTLSNGLSDTVLEYIADIEVYQNESIVQYSNVIDDDFHIAFDGILKEIDNLPNDVYQIQGNTTQVFDVLSNITNFVTQINETNIILWDIEDTISTMQESTEALQYSIEQLQVGLENDLDVINCTSLSCFETIDYVSQLYVTLNVTDLSVLAIMEAFDNATRDEVDNIYTGLELSIVEMDRIYGVINTSTNSSVTRLWIEVNVLYGNIQDLTELVTQEISDVNIEKASSYVKDDFQPWLRYTGDITFYTMLVVCILLLIITTLAYISFGFGACGARAGLGAPTCNRGNSTTLLFVTSIFIYTLAWILMLGASFFLIIGGVIHNDVCKHLVRENPNADAIATVDYMFTNNLNFSNNLYTSMQNCKENDALYTSFSISSRGPEYNITDVITTADNRIVNEFQNLINVNITYDDINLSNDMLTPYLLMIDGALQDTDLAPFIKAAQDNITSLPMLDVSNYLKQAAESEPEVDIKSVYEDYSARFSNLNDQQVKAIEEQLSIFLDNVNILDDFTKSLDIQLTVELLEKAQNYITPSLTSEIMANVSEGIYLDIAHVSVYVHDTITQNLAPCRSVFVSVHGISEHFCIQFLYPVNALWYTLGWCCFFFIFLLIIASYLAELYRKTDKYIEPFVPMTRMPSYHRHHRNSSRRRREKMRMNRELQLLAIEQARLEGSSPIDDGAVNPFYTVHYRGEDDGGFYEYSVRLSQRPSKRNKRKTQQDPENINLTNMAGHGDVIDDVQHSQSDSANVSDGEVNRVDYSVRSAYDGTVNPAFSTFSDRPTSQREPSAIQPNPSSSDTTNPTSDAVPEQRRMFTEGKYKMYRNAPAKQTAMFEASTNSPDVIQSTAVRPNNSLNPNTNGTTSPQSIHTVSQNTRSVDNQQIISPLSNKTVQSPTSRQLTQPKKFSPSIRTTQTATTPKLFTSEASSSQTDTHQLTEPTVVSSPTTPSQSPFAYQPFETYQSQTANTPQLTQPKTFPPPTTPTQTAYTYQPFEIRRPQVLGSSTQAAIIVNDSYTPASNIYAIQDPYANRPRGRSLSNSSKPRNSSKRSKNSKKGRSKSADSNNQRIENTESDTGHDISDTGFNDTEHLVRPSSPYRVRSPSQQYTIEHSYAASGFINAAYF